MYPVLWTPLIGSTTNIGFSDSIIDGTNVAFEDGICGNNAKVGTSVVYPITNSDMTTKGFSLSMYVKLVAGMTVFKYQAGTKTLMGVMVDSMNMAIKYDIGSGEYKTLFVMDCHDSIGKWISFVYTYDGANMSYVYINGNYIASSNKKPFAISTSDTLKFVFSSCSLFNVKIYVGVISKRQILDDYYCLLAGYKFDGTGTTGDMTTECDYSGFNHDIVSENNLGSINLGVGTQKYTFITNDVQLVEEKTSWDTFFINFWICSTLMRTSSPRTIFKYGTVLTITIKYDGSSGQTALTITYSASDTNAQTYSKTIQSGELYMISLSQSADGFKAYIDCENVINTSNFSILSGSVFTLCACKCIYLDFRCYFRTPNEDYIKILYNSSMRIDDKGTLCSGSMTEVDKPQLSFDNDNGFMAKNINISEDCPNAMKYDTVNKVLTVKDFIDF